MNIQNYEIPENIQNDKFIISVFNQYEEKGYLSYKQECALKDILNISEELPSIEFKEYKIFKRNFYRFDYHGDPLCDSRVSILTEDTIVDFNSKIINESAREHGVIEYEPEYEITGKCLIPLNTKSPKLFFSYLYEFNKIYDKIKRNKFRSVRNRNIAIRAIKNLIDSESYIDTKLLDEAIGKKYW